MQGWLVYVLMSGDETRTYVGITVELERRLDQHNGTLPGGAKSTRAGRPWTIVVRYGPFATRSEAQVLEARLKRRSGRARLEPV